MNAQTWVDGRQNVHLTQIQAARALGLSQPYLSQLENGSRHAPPDLVRKATNLYKLPPTVLPLSQATTRLGNVADLLEKELAGLGYPGFAHVRAAAKRNPAAVVLTAITQPELDARLIEALPWVMGRFTEMNWPWLRDHAKQHNAQNRLGYLIHLAKKATDADGLRVLSRWEHELEAARLAGEGTLCRDSMSQPERDWVRARRPRTAAHWNLLTTLTHDQLSYATK